MKTPKFLIASILVIAVLAMQITTVFAAPSLQEGSITGTVTALACETDATTGETTFLVTVQATDGTSQTVRIDQATAEGLGLITVIDGVADCSAEALAAANGMEVTIDPTTVIPDAEEEDEEPKHPVAAALALFFSDITDYDTIIDAHEDGFGFGVITQALFMADKMEGDSVTFLAILDAKKSGDYSAFTLEDGTSPKNWGQFRKAVLKGEKVNLGTVKSNNGNGNGNGGGNGNGNGNGGGNGNGNGNGGGNGNGNGNGGGNGNGNGKGKP